MLPRATKDEVSGISSETARAESPPVPNHVQVDFILKEAGKYLDKRLTMRFEALLNMLM